MSVKAVREKKVKLRGEVGVIHMLSLLSTSGQKSDWRDNFCVILNATFFKVCATSVESVSHIFAAVWTTTSPS